MSDYTKAVSKSLEPATHVKEGITGGRNKGIWAAVCIGVPLLLYVSPLGLDPKVQMAMAIATFMLLCWMTQIVDYAIAGLMGCLLFWASGVVEPEVAFAGFAEDITWFVLAALVIGVVGTTSTLPQRVGAFIVGRVGLSYSGILLGLIITDFVLTFLVPTGSGRVVIMATIAIGIIKLFGMEKGSNIGRGIFLIITYTATIFDKMVIAGAASITARGAITQYGGVDIGWSEWFIAFLPADILTILAAWRLTIWMFPPEVNDIRGKKNELRQQFHFEAKWSAKSIRASAIILVTIGLWLTDALHGIDPGMVAFAAAMIALAPFVGVVSMEEFKKIDLMPVLFVGAALSMSAVLSQTGALTVLTQFMLAGVESHLKDDFLAVPILYWGAFVYHLFLASEISMLATSLPILMEFATEHSLNPLWIGLVWTFAAGGKIFVYQTAVLVIGYSFGYFKHTDLIKMGLAITLVEFVSVIFIVTLWWPMIGIIE